MLSEESSSKRAQCWSWPVCQENCFPSEIALFLRPSWVCDAGAESRQGLATVPCLGLSVSSIRNSWNTPCPLVLQGPCFLQWVQAPRQGLLLSALLVTPIPLPELNGSCERLGKQVRHRLAHGWCSGPSSSKISGLSTKLYCSVKSLKVMGERNSLPKLIKIRTQPVLEVACCITPALVRLK